MVMIWSHPTGIQPFYFADLPGSTKEFDVKKELLSLKVPANTPEK